MSLSQSISNHVLSLPPEKQAEVLDFLFLEERRKEGEKSGAPKDLEARRRRAAAALDALRQSRVFSHIADPVAWQREIRKDRPLPGREEQE